MIVDALMVYLLLGMAYVSLKFIFDGVRVREQRLDASTYLYIHTGKRLKPETIAALQIGLGVLLWPAPLAILVRRMFGP